VTGEKHRKKILTGNLGGQNDEGVDGEKRRRMTLWKRRCKAKAKSRRGKRQ